MDPGNEDVPHRIVLELSRSPEKVLRRIRKRPDIEFVRFIPRSTEARWFGWATQSGFKLGKVSDFYNVDKVVPRIVGRLEPAPHGSTLSLEFRYRIGTMSFLSLAMVVAPALLFWSGEAAFIMIGALILVAGGLTIWKNPHRSKVDLAAFVHELLRDLIVETSASESPYRSDSAEP